MWNSRKYEGLKKPLITLMRHNIRCNSIKVGEEINTSGKYKAQLKANDKGQMLWSKRGLYLIIWWTRASPPKESMRRGQKRHKENVSYILSLSFSSQFGSVSKRARWKRMLRAWRSLMLYTLLIRQFYAAGIKDDILDCSDFGDC